MKQKYKDTDFILYLFYFFCKKVIDNLQNIWYTFIVRKEEEMKKNGKKRKFKIKKELTLFEMITLILMLISLVLDIIRFLNGA